MKFFLIVIGLSFMILGAAEMHVQKSPVHDFHAAAIVKIYPPIESSLHNNAAGVALAQGKIR